MQNDVVELLEVKFIYYVDQMSEWLDIDKKKHFFINYGLNNQEYAGYCLDFIDMFCELERAIMLEQLEVDIKEKEERKGFSKLFGADA